MHIFKVNYIIQYSHILTFSTEYRKQIAPFFAMPDLKYSFLNQDTFDEQIRLLFENSGFAVICQKEATVLIFEGNIDDLKRSSGAAISTFFDIFSAIKSMNGFGRILFHEIQFSALFPRKNPPDELTAISGSKVLKSAPFHNPKEFSINFEGVIEGLVLNVLVGNFGRDDKSKFDLTPLKTQHNETVLREGIGYFSSIKYKEFTDSASFSKFKSLFDKSIGQLENLNEWI